MGVGVFVLGRGYLHERGGICVEEGVFVWERVFVKERGCLGVGEGEFLEPGPGRNPMQDPIGSCRILQDLVRILKLTGS